MISGDVERNPGPDSDKRNRKTCSICSRTIASNHRHVECSTCKTTCHIKCCGVSVDYYRALHSSVILSWKCIACTIMMNETNVSEVYGSGEDDYYVIIEQ